MNLLDVKEFVAFIVSNPIDNDVIQAQRMLDRDFGETYAGKSALVVGCNEDPFANTLGTIGCRTKGIDLRPYNGGDISNGYAGEPLYEHIHADILTHEIKDTFDLIVSISVVEHIGLGYYGGKVTPEGDIDAMENISKLLSPTGVCYITVPIGGSWKETAHWRRYTLDSISRLTKHFTEIERKYFQTSYLGWDEVDEEAVKNYHDSTDISVLLKLGK